MIVNEPDDRCVRCDSTDLEWDVDADGYPSCVCLTCLAEDDPGNFQTIQSSPKAPCQHSSDRDTDIANLTADLAAERALADQLASHLEWALRCVGSLPMELRTTFDNRMAEVLAAWEKARRER
jgi:hypothetical protein